MNNRKVGLTAAAITLMTWGSAQAVQVEEPYCNDGSDRDKYCEFKIRLDLITPRDYTFIEEADGRVQFTWKVPLTDQASLRDLKRSAERELALLEQQGQVEMDRLIGREDEKLNHLINPRGNRQTTSTEKAEAAQRETLRLLASSYKTIEDNYIDSAIALLGDVWKQMERDPLVAQTQKIEVTFTVLQNTFKIIKNITKTVLKGGCPEISDIKSTVQALAALYDQYKKWTRELDVDLKELVNLTDRFDDLQRGNSVPMQEGKDAADKMVKAAIDLDKKMSRLRSGRLKNLSVETAQLTDQVRELLSTLNESNIHPAELDRLTAQLEENLKNIQKLDRMMKDAADHLRTISESITPQFKFTRNWKEKLSEWYVGSKFDDQRRLRQKMVDDMNETEGQAAVLISITTTNMADAGQCSQLFDQI